MRHLAPTRMPAMLAALLLLSACAAPPAPKHHHADARVLLAKARAQREHVMQETWRGQTYHALLAQYGPPSFVMSHPARRDPGSDIVIYGVRDALTNCIDAFTLIVPKPSHEQMVADYFCR